MNTINFSCNSIKNLPLYTQFIDLFNKDINLNNHEKAVQLYNMLPPDCTAIIINIDIATEELFTVFNNHNKKLYIHVEV